MDYTGPGRSQKKYLKHAGKPRVAVSMVLNEDKTEIIEIEEILAEDSDEEEGFPIAKQQQKCIKLQRAASYESGNIKLDAVYNDNTEVKAENDINQFLIKSEELHIKDEAENTNQDKKVKPEIVKFHDVEISNKKFERSYNDETDIRVKNTSCHLKITNEEDNVIFDEEEENTHEDSLPTDLNKRVKRDKQNGGQGKGRKGIAQLDGGTRGLGAQIHHCTICGYQTTKPYRFTRHLRIHNRDNSKKYSCPKCIFHTTWKQAFDRHLRRHDGCAIKKETCKKCKLETIRKDGLKGHVCKIKGFTCHDCGFQTTTKNLIRKHINTHRTFVEKRFKCNVCKFGSKYKHHLANHMESHKQGDARRFKCDECNFRTRQKGNLTRHWSIKHGDGKDVASFMCFHCNFRTSEKYRLKMHLLKHNERNRQEAKTLRCPECDYTSIYKSALKVHVWKHKKPNEIPMVECTKCSYRTFRKSNLARHFRTHN